jgi:hypothetical protein
MSFQALGHLGIVKEAGWGTPQAATDYIPILSESLTRDIEQLISDEIRANRFAPPQYAGFQSVKGDIQFDARPISLGFFLRSLMGAPNTQGGGPYTHTFTTPAAEFVAGVCTYPSYTFEVNRDLGANALQYAGCCVNALTLEFSASQKILRATAEILGKTVANIAKTSPTLDAGVPFLWKDATVTIAAAQNLLLESFRIKITNNLEQLALINVTNEPAGIVQNGYTTAEMDLTFNANDYTEYNRFTGQGEATFSVDFNPDASNELKIETNKMRYVGYQLGIQGARRGTIGISAVAKYDSALTAPVKITLKNTKATY